MYFIIMPLSAFENYNKNNIKLMTKKKLLGESSIAFVFKDIKVIRLLQEIKL